MTEATSTVIDLVAELRGKLVDELCANGSRLASTASCLARRCCVGFHGPSER